MGKYSHYVDPHNYILPGDVIECYFVAKYVGLSWMISVIGALLTLESLARRTSRKGSYNFGLLCLAAFFMGAISTWSMQYLAQMGTMTGWGDDSYQVVQSQYFVIGNFIMPIFGFGLAFYILGGRDRPITWQVIIAGIIAGLVNTSSFLLSQYGITNYNVSFKIGYIAGAAALATAGNTWIYFSLFWVRRHFQNRWFRLLFFAINSSASTAGLHWMMMLGTTYTYRKDLDFAKNFKFRNTFAVVVTATGAFAILMLIMFIACGRARDTRTKNNTVRITLLSIMFTHDGKVLVNPDGTLPEQKICKNHEDRAFDDAFEPHNPIFHWMLRVSLNWRCIADVMGVIRYHRHQLIRREEEDIQYWDDRTFSVYLRESFVVAANKLAAHLRIPLTKMGTLYEEVYYCGTPLAFKDERDDLVTKAEQEFERKRGPKGRMLFLTRVISAEEAKAMEPRGFRYADLDEIENKLAWMTQTVKPKITEYIHGLKKRTFEKITANIAPGVYFSLFGLRPCMVGGFEVCVEKNCHQQIPMLKMPLKSVTRKQAALMELFDGLSLKELMPILQVKWDKDLEEEERELLKALSQVLQWVVADKHKALWENAYIIGTPTFFPCRSNNNTGLDITGGVAFTFGLRTMLPIHDESHESLDYDFIPFQMVNIPQKTFKEEIVHFHNAIIREFSTKARDIYHEELERIESGLLPKLVRTWTSSRRSSTSSADPLCVPGDGGDWDPTIPSEFEAEDPQSWLEKFYLVTTQAARARGPGLAARYGAYRASVSNWGRR